MDEYTPLQSDKRPNNRQFFLVTDQAPPITPNAVTLLVPVFLLLRQFLLSSHTPSSSSENSSFPPLPLPPLPPPPHPNLLDSSAPYAQTEDAFSPPMNGYAVVIIVVRIGTGTELPLPLPSFHATSKSASVHPPSKPCPPSHQPVQQR